MKKKLLIILLIMITTIFTIGIAYSAFSSSATLSMVDQKIAKFVFDAKTTDEIELPLVSLEPNSKKDYLFSVTNSQKDIVSNVTINYQIIVKTFHYMPLEIKLYKEGEDNVILSCDETYSRDSDNILVCNSPIQELSHTKKGLDNYKLEVSFPKEYNSEEYADLVDFIDIYIKSWQKK